MDYRQAYATALSELGNPEISIGYSGIEFCPPDKIRDYQAGYSVTPNGKNLVDDIKPGSWRSTWIVIARDTLIGDPIFVDTGSANFPVMTAVHGEGDWEPRTIASSLESFFACLSEVRQLASGRETPVALESNPISLVDRKQFLARISELNRSEIHAEFWDTLIGSEEPLV